MTHHSKPVAAAADKPRVRPYLDFYQQEAISPVAQDIGNLDRHFQRREALYRHLGIVPALIEGRSVIEFGPGSGHNALFTASLKPARYLLVDGNSVGIAECRDLLTAHTRRGNVSVEQALLEEFETDERFDVVLCEGVLSWQFDPVHLLRRISRFAKPGGVVVITCMDTMGFLAEALRRFASAVLMKPEATPAENLAHLTRVFGPHLATIKGMSRSHEHWVQDNLLFPYYGRPFPIDAAIKAIDAEFEVYGASPQFLSDVRWYKTIHGDERRYNERALSAYWQNIHNHLDGRSVTGPRPEAANQALRAECDAVFELQEDYRRTREPSILKVALARLQTITAMVGEFSDVTAASLADFTDAMQKGFPGKVPDFGRFTPWFGMGQQYVSFLRRGRA